LTQDFSDGDPSIAIYLHQVCDAVAARLGEYNVSLSPQETLWSAVAWLRGQVEEQVSPPEIIVREIAVSDAAQAIVAVLLSGIAEERPGTYPFEHDAVIPVPLPVLMRTIHALAIIANLATQNGKNHQIGYLTAAIGALARIAAESNILEQDSISSSDEDGSDLNIEPPYCMAPQPGLAFCARIIEGAARDLRDHVLEPRVDGEEIDGQLLAESLENDASGLRLLNHVFGVNPNSPE